MVTFGRCASRRSAALRAEPVALSQAKPAAAIARKRNWRGRFVKNLRPTPDGSREWLIWSHYHGAWHCRSSEGGACGYTCDIANAGLFERAKADAYNDGDRNEAFHVSEKLALIYAAIRQHNEALENLLFASAMSAGTAATTQIGAGLQPASATRQGDAQTPVSIPIARGP